MDPCPIDIIQRVVDFFQVLLNKNYKVYFRANHTLMHANNLIQNKDMQLNQILPCVI